MRKVAVDERQIQRSWKKQLTKITGFKLDIQGFIERENHLISVDVVVEISRFLEEIFTSEKILQKIFTEGSISGSIQQNVYPAHVMNVLAELTVIELPFRVSFAKLVFVDSSSRIIEQ